MRRKVSIFVVAAVFLFTPFANADVKPIQFGVYGEAITSPYPSFPGIGVTASFFDLVRVEAGVGIVKTAIAMLAGVYAISTGIGLKFRVPNLKVSPVLGIGYGLTRISATESALFGFRDTVEEYLTPTLSVEIRNGDSFYWGIGIAMTFKKDSTGAYRKETHELALIGNEDGGTELPFIPMIYMGLRFN